MASNVDRLIGVLTASLDDATANELIAAVRTVCLDRAHQLIKTSATPAQTASAMQWNWYASKLNRLSHIAS